MSNAKQNTAPLSSEEKAIDLGTVSTAVAAGFAGAVGGEFAKAGAQAIIGRLAKPKDPEPPASRVILPPGADHDKG